MFHRLEKKVDTMSDLMQDRTSDINSIQLMRENTVENKMVLFGSKFWVSRTVRTLTIAVLGPIATETRRHPFSIPRRPFISNHVSLASHLIVVLTAHLYATAFFVCIRRILSSSPHLPFICTHVFSCFSFDCCMGTVRLLVL